MAAAVLGDLIESLVCSDAQIRGLKYNRRLERVFTELRLRATMRVVPGNHDAKALGFLRRHFGPHRVFAGGFRVGRVVFVHGHEFGLDASPVAEQFAGVVPLGAALNHLGFQPQIGIASNDDIASLYVPRRLFPVFGHTHVPCAGPRFANSGSFLATEASFILLSGHSLTLWRDAA
jgi:hypothetical protein